MLVKKYNQNSLFNDDGIIHHKNMIPAFVGDIFESVANLIIGGKRISQGTGKRYCLRCDLAKSNFMFEVKSSKIKHYCIISNEQFEYQRKINDNLFKHNGNLIYIIFNYDLNWKDYYYKKIDSIVGVILKSITSVLFIEHYVIGDEVKINKGVKTGFNYSKLVKSCSTFKIDYLNNGICDFDAYVFETYTFDKNMLLNLFKIPKKIDIDCSNGKLIQGLPF